MRRADIIGLVVFAALLAALAGGLNLLQTAGQEKAELRTALVANELASKIEGHMGDRLSLINILRGDILRGVINDQKSFKRRASEIRKNVPGFFAISWVDRDGTIRWTSKAPEAKDPRGFNLNKHPVAGPVFRRLQREHGITGVTPPLDLLLGGRGIVVLVPVVGHSGSKGYVGAVFRIDRMIAGAVGANIAGRYLISIRDGDEPVLQADTPVSGTFGRGTSRIRIGDRIWTMSLAPRPGVLGLFENNTRDSILVLVGVLLSLALAWLLRSVVVRNEDLRASEARFRNYCEASSDWFWEMDEHLRFSFFSARFEQVTGVSPTALLGKTRRETGIPDVDPDAWEAHLLALEERRPFRNFIHSRIRDDGRTVWLAISGIPIFMGNGRFVGFRGTGRDITETWEVEAELQESRMRLKAILDHAPASIYLKDADGRYILANRAFLDRYEKSEADILGRTSRQVFADEDVEPHAVVDDDVVRTGAVRQAELQDVGQTDRVTHAIKFPVPDADGNIAAIGGIETDVTDRKRSEESLVQALEQADLASRAKSEFLANVSHELRTPLNAIIGFSEVVKDEMMGSLGNERYREYIGDIHQSGRHLLSLINDILDLSKIEAGKLELEESDVPVTDLVRACLRLMAQQAEVEGLDLIADLHEPLPPVRSDSRVLKQILLNLLSNAIKFTMAGGEVKVTARGSASNGLVLEVSDTGIGMTPEDLEVAMTPFARGGSAMVRQHEGTGLGLPLVNRFVTGLGAKLTIDSRFQEGTTVRVEFQAARNGVSDPPVTALRTLRADRATSLDLQENDISASDTGLPGKAATG